MAIGHHRRAGERIRSRQTQSVGIVAGCFNVSKGGARTRREKGVFASNGREPCRPNHRDDVPQCRRAGVQAVARGPGLNSGPYKVGLHRLTRVVRSDLVEFEPTGAY
jgi:hypothetical protein